MSISRTVFLVATMIFVASAAVIGSYHPSFEGFFTNTNAHDWHVVIVVISTGAAESAEPLKFDLSSLVTYIYRAGQLIFGFRQITSVLGVGFNPDDKERDKGS